MDDQKRIQNKKAEQTKSGFLHILKIQEALISRIILVNSLHSFFLDKIAHDPTVHLLHQESLKIVVGEAEVKVELRIHLGLLGYLLDQEVGSKMLELAALTHLHLLEAVDVVFFVFLRQAEGEHWLLIALLKLHFRHDLLYITKTIKNNHIKLLAFPPTLENNFEDLA